MPRRYDLDWSQADEDTAKLFLKQAELYLDVQMRLALAADTQAMATSGALAALATAIVASSVALVGFVHDARLLYGGLPTAVMLLIAAVIAVRVARPVALGHIGTEPIRWWTHRNETTRDYGCARLQMPDENNIPCSLGGRLLPKPWRPALH